MSDNNKTLEQEFEEESGYSANAIITKFKPEGNILTVPYEEWLKEKVTSLRAENAEQAKRIAELGEALRIEVKARVKFTEQYMAEREKNKRPDCRKCVCIASKYCDNCKWCELKFRDDNYKEAD